MIVNLGSLNIDYVYDVDHFVQPGETLASASMNVHAGGKGLNQSIAAARAGAVVRHAGCIGRDGDFLRDLLVENGVDITLLRQLDQPGGHAIIQVDRHGQNCILLYAGTNQTLDSGFLKALAEGLTGREIVLLQNETSGTVEMMQLAKAKGCRIAFNPAPMDPGVLNYPLELVDYLILNETEGAALAGETDPEKILAVLAGRYPEGNTILTLGGDGVIYLDGCQACRIPAVSPGRVLDTTAAGDTFIGYFLTAIDEGSAIGEAIGQAVKAAGICVTRKGAASSIPFRSEIS